MTVAAQKESQSLANVATLQRWDEQAGLPGVAICSRIEAHSGAKKENGHEKEYQQNEEDAAAECTPEAERQGDEKAGRNSVIR